MRWRETVTWHVRTVTQDEYGNDVETWSDTTVTGCAVWPRTSTENTSGQDTVITGITVMVPASAPVEPTALDQVTVRGVRYEVDGQPGYWSSSLTGTVAGTEVALRRAA